MQPLSAADTGSHNAPDAFNQQPERTHAKRKPMLRDGEDGGDAVVMFRGMGGWRGGVKEGIRWCVGCWPELGWPEILPEKMGAPERGGRRKKYVLGF
ncbi:hypothetical protein Tco_0845423 [Tanacetum coccineum]